MKHALGLLIVLGSLIACQGPQGIQGIQGPQGSPGNVSGTIPPTPVPPTQPTAIQSLVDNYNEYLVSQGNDPIVPGLKCTLYTVPNMPATPCLASDITGCSVISSSAGYASVASFPYTESIDQPNEAGASGFNLLPLALQGLYPTNFAVTCTGYFVNTDYNYHEFDVASDDGSLLYVGGSLIVQNDGLHAITDVKGMKYLEAEVYSFRVDYFQGPGNVALIVNMDGAVLPAANLYH
jgi:hypothetical protein